MPNWCECELRIYGKKLNLNKFKKFAKTKEKILDEEKFIPYPEKFKQRDKLAELKPKGQNIKDGFNSGGYEWCCDNWGTKWGICRAELADDNGDELEYFFECAWSPCIPVVKKMAEMFPKLRFEMVYFEQGAGFNGLLVCEKGKVITDKTGEYFGHRGG